MWSYYKYKEIVLFYLLLLIHILWFIFSDVQKADIKVSIHSLLLSQIVTSETKKIYDKNSCKIY